MRTNFFFASSDKRDSLEAVSRRISQSLYAKTCK